MEAENCCVVPVWSVAEGGLTATEMVVLSGGVLGTEEGEPVDPVQPVKPREMAKIPASTHLLQRFEHSGKLLLATPLATSKLHGDRWEGMVLDRQRIARSMRYLLTERTDFSQLARLEEVVQPAISRSSRWATVFRSDSEMPGCPSDPKSICLATRAFSGNWEGQGARVSWAIRVH